ncbi:MAG TPA: GspE/PulE family protein [Ideonella sp.]|uniref:GspE/PulE family protein n=1 Tax=Ideonella sp. TaxID=1929293 RepID=UPI002B6931ED|nr:GspE/PulE family protein [Ideonella sp.]HSI50817.1 GspE/PulE family protein [Ideonella sp.]
MPEQPPAFDLLAAVARARAQHRAGQGAVLDLLEKAHGDSAALHAGLAASTGVNVLDDETLRATAADFSRWSREAARQARCVMLQAAHGPALLAMEDPWDEAALQRVSGKVGALPLVVACRRAQLLGWLDEGSAPAASREAGGSPSHNADGPVVQFVNDAVSSGFSNGASDVHFECDRQGVTVKLRLDGVLMPHARMDSHTRAEEVISRIKVLAALDITERRVPQDGRFRLGIAGTQVDLRVSIMPSVHGEDAVLRLLDKTQLRGQGEAVSLESLGFNQSAGHPIRGLAGLPSGMLLVTGPTGSGKTTTVYAVLSEINTGLEKIITIEDPVEYELPGVLQIPVNERKGLTFAKGLRSILRHDPDRILVGEIRDAETAEIAVQSALTGHQVFTTVHANSMSDIIGRFRHFDIDMFGFMSALNGVVVQRLLRKVCAQCSTWHPLPEQERPWVAAAMGEAAPSKVPEPVGCDACRHTGYRGRFVVAEVHVVDDALRDLITEGAPLSALKLHAIQQGVTPLLALALGHVRNGATTLAEVRRVIGGGVGA